MSVGWNTGPGHHLLGPQCKISGPGSTADLDEDLAMVAKVNKVFAFSGAKYGPGLGGLADGLTIGQALPQQLVHADTSDAKKSGVADHISRAQATVAPVILTLQQGMGRRKAGIYPRSKTGDL
jgi:hypothetical protein